MLESKVSVLYQILISFDLFQALVQSYYSRPSNQTHFIEIHQSESIKIYLEIKDKISFDQSQKIMVFVLK
jgi:hypothetical protein